MGYGREKALDKLLEQFKEKFEPDELEYLLYMGSFLYRSGVGLTYSEVRERITKAYGRSPTDKYMKLKG